MTSAGGVGAVVAVKYGKEGMFNVECLLSGF